MNLEDVVSKAAASIGKDSNGHQLKKKEVQQNVNELTLLKMKAAEERIKEIDTKIAALQKERDNLVRKNENRQLSLQERK